MGGIGSGQHLAASAKRTTSDGLTLNINKIGLTSKEFVEAWKENYTIESSKGAIRWTRDGKEIATAGCLVYGQGEGIRIELRFSITRDGNKEAIKEPIPIVSTEHNGGGLRFWFLCPLVKNGRVCHNRVSKLYLPPGAKYFGCRECYNLTYRSSQESHKFDGLNSMLARQLGCSPKDIKEALKYWS